jgi:thioredoxin reductase
MITGDNGLYDSVIIGGGPAGLTCGYFLARARRSVVIVDSGQPRNAATWAIHGFLGHEEITPDELRRRGRRQAEGAGSQFVEATATSARREETFLVETTCGPLRARTLVLAYGLRDVRPDIPRFGEFYGRSIFHCPDCDAGDFADQPLGVVGSEKKAAAMTLLLRQWTPRLSLLTNGRAAEWDEQAQTALRSERVRVHTEPIVRLHGADGLLERVELSSGECVEVAGLFFAVATERCCGIAEELGCELDEVRPHVKVDHHKQTSIPGVYAIGDLIAGSQLAVTAAADGAIAAISINKDLLPTAWTLS